MPHAHKLLIRPAAEAGQPWGLKYTLDHGFHWRIEGPFASKAEAEERQTALIVTCYPLAGYIVSQVFPWRGDAA